MGKQKLKIQFDAQQSHQLGAVEQIVRIFEGVPPREVSALQHEGSMVGNLLPHEALEPRHLEENLQELAEDYNKGAKEKGLTEIPAIRRLATDQGFMLENVSNETHQYPSFTVEMETGTGKTYVYLRSIYELRKQYGFRKFIIIVPSRAIYEGVSKSFEITREHFKALYDNETVQLLRYQSGRISKLRDFATNPDVVVMVMTIDAFNKASNNIYKATEKLPGEKLPFEYIQATRPILILDESQNYLTNKAKTALRTLRPLCAFNFSATPVEKPNLIYRLTPIDAFKKQLVKSIEVLGVSEIYNANDHQLSFQFTDEGVGYGLAIEASLNVLEKGELVRRTLKLRKGENLYEKTGNEAYRGLVIEEVSRRDNTVYFTNGESLALDSATGSGTTKRDIFRSQIEETIRIHMQKQRDLLPKGIKVLSLFFIDRVANYIDEEGVIKVLFDEAYERIKQEFPFYKGWSAHEVREGYFAQKQTKKGVEFIDTKIEGKTTKDKEAEKAAYELIMQKKELLLSFEEKVSFIFAHSALKEGWDNPNVFQICTLNQTTSERKKRQEIGRGLRIPVNQEGERDFDQSTNILTVIANESYEAFVAGLQTEYREANDIPPPKPSNARRIPAHRNDELFAGEDFQTFWKKLTRKTSYQINVDTDRLIQRCAEVLKSKPLPEPQLMISRGRFMIETYTLTLLDVKTKMVQLEILREDTGGNIRKDNHWFSKGDRVSKIAKDDNLKGFMIVDFEERGAESKVYFSDAGELTIGQSLQYSPAHRISEVEKRQQASQSTYQIPNFIERAARETRLTKRTLVRILKELGEERIAKIERNPEAFSTMFIHLIKEELATHIAENVTYELTEELMGLDLEVVFPKSQKFPQKELVDGKDWSLYDQVQYDSEIERKFILNKLNEDDQIICYFKFPPKFRIGLPRLIGNYNPDWGIIRNTEDGLKLELVRETKGQLNVNLLQWPNERRKIECARKHFAQLGINYRVIVGDEKKWW